MITSFQHRGLKRFYERGEKSKLPPDMIDRIERILADLDDAKAPEDLNLASYRLHQLSGDRKGQWSITVRANWRIVFAFDGQDICNVDFVDYH